MELLKILTCVLCGFFFGIYAGIKVKPEEESYNITKDTIIIKPNNLHTRVLNKEELLNVIDYYDIKYSNIVYTQALLETGYFESKICKEYNNLFGLYNSKTKDYYKFNHWSESVLAYKRYVQHKYKEGDYYEFLERLPYAEDTLYVSKLKHILQNNG